MSTIPFDTHAFYVELVESGLAEKTAEALTKAVTKIEMAKIEELATKRDIVEMKAELQRWTVTVVMGTAILQTAIIAALILKLTAHI
jgi:hypothetical protein